MIKRGEKHYDEIRGRIGTPCENPPSVGTPPNDYKPFHWNGRHMENLLIAAVARDNGVKLPKGLAHTLGNAKAEGIAQELSAYYAESGIAQGPDSADVLVQKLQRRTCELCATRTAGD